MSHAASSVHGARSSARGKALKWAMVVAGIAHPAHAQEAPHCALPVSAFWQDLDRVCTHADTIEAALASTPENERATASEVLAYCRSRTPPAFAAAAFDVRARSLAPLMRSLELPPQAAVGSFHFETQLAPWIDELANSLVSDPALRTGAAGDLVVSELMSHVCNDGAVREQLPSTCSAWSNGGLVELRRRLIADLAALPLRAADRGDARYMALAVPGALLTRDPIAALAFQLGPRVCPKTPELWAAAERNARGAAELSGVLLWRLMLDGPDMRQTPEHYVRVAQTVLGGRAGKTASLSAAQRAAVARLVAALRSARSAQEHLSTAPATSPNAAELGRALFDAVDALLAVTLDSSSPSIAEARRFAEALVRGELADAAKLAIALMPSARVPEPVAQAALLAARLSMARDEDHAKRILRSVIIPLGPWTEPFLFGINADVPRLDNRDFSVIGDATLGYNGNDWGVVGSGALHEYDLTTDDLISQISNREATLEAWFTLRPSSALRIELRGVGGAAYYDTTKFTLASTATQTLADETSWLGRGLLLTSLRYQPGSRFASGLWLGAGGQYESYSRLDVGIPGQRSATTLDEESFSLILTARLRAEYEIWERVLAARLFVNAKRFGITRDSLRVSRIAGAITTEAPAESMTQTEVMTRVFLDAEVARFFGFVPGLNAGFDYLELASGAESHSAFVPVVGAGIRRDAF